MDFVLKLLSFIQQEVFIVDPQRLPRARRRQMLRRGVPPEHVDRTINVVHLRPALRAPSPGKDGATREHEHHWWLRGHWRAQWYPSRGVHEVIWIQPHIKGDLEKPLLHKIYDICR
jgi:hypothetical protein